MIAIIRLELAGWLTLLTGRGMSLCFRDRWRIVRGGRRLSRLLGYSASLRVCGLAGALAVRHGLGELGAVELVERAAKIAAQPGMDRFGVELLLPIYAEATAQLNREDQTRRLCRIVTAPEYVPSNN